MVLATSVRVLVATFSGSPQGIYRNTALAPLRSVPRGAALPLLVITLHAATTSPRVFVAGGVLFTDCTIPANSYNVRRYHRS